MIARRLSDGKEIEVVQGLSSSGVSLFWHEPEKIAYSSRDLDFDVEYEHTETFEGYIYRDRGGDLSIGLSMQRATRLETFLPKGSFPNVKLSDGIIPVTITIKTKKK